MSGVAGKVYVHLYYGLDVRGHSSRFAQGLVSDASPYGFHLTREFGWTVSFSEDELESTLTKFFRRVVKRCLGFDLLHTYRNRQNMRECDIIWTMTEYEWLSVAMLQVLGVIPKRPMIGNTISLLNKWHRLGPIKKCLYKILANRCAVLTVHSIKGIPIAKDAFFPSRIQLMYFGVSTSTYQITSPVKPLRAASRRKILAIGIDKTRDWKTFVDSFGNDPTFELVLVCSWAPRNYEKRYRNLKVRRCLAGKEFSEVYASSDIVVIPMHENVYSGITVLLEAVASGKPVIASRTGGCPTYFDDDEVTYVPCDDPIAMRKAAMDLDKLHEKAIKAQAKFQTRDYSTGGMIGRYSALTKEILQSESAVDVRNYVREWQEQELTPLHW